MGGSVRYWWVVGGKLEVMGGSWRKWGVVGGSEGSGGSRG